MPIGSYHSDAFEPQVLLIDAGCEWDNYASDITRTIPVGNGGQYTQEAGHIYELVLRMQKVCRFGRPASIVLTAIRNAKRWSSPDPIGTRSISKRTRS